MSTDTPVLTDDALLASLRRECARWSTRDWLEAGFARLFALRDEALGRGLRCPCRARCTTRTADRRSPDPIPTTPKVPCPTPTPAAPHPRPVYVRTGPSSRRSLLTHPPRRATSRRWTRRPTSTTWARRCAPTKRTDPARADRRLSRPWQDPERPGMSDFPS